MTDRFTDLMRLLPTDANGPHRESLASWIVRIARENDVSPAQLLERKFSSDVGLGGLSCSSRALGVSIGQSVNGSSAFTERIVLRAEQLTKMVNLRASTTLAFAPFTTINGLLRQSLAWGAEFLRESQVKSYPLLWALEPVRVCIREKRPLLSLCPSCRKPILILSGGSRVGVCNYCAAVLDNRKFISATADPVAGAIRSMDYEIWVAEQLGDYIRFQIHDSLPGDFSYAASIKFWFERFALTANTGTAAALGTSQMAMKNWLHTGSIPRLRMTLNLCWVFGVSLLQFLTREVPNGHDGKLRPSIDGNVRQASLSSRRRIDKPKLEGELVAIIRENRYAMMPFAEICEKKLKRRALVVRQNFPELGRAIAKRYLENRRLMAQVKQAQFCAAIKTLARFLHLRGIVPNHKTLKPYLDRASRLRCEWAMKALCEVRAELGYEEESEQLLLAV